MATCRTKVTLNCDMGESFGLYKMGDDDSLFPLIDLANVACGFHASDSSVMSDTVQKAKLNGISVGAHPSFPDLQGFGRREMKLTRQEVKDTVMYQVGALKGFLDTNNMKLNHIKPHGSLYGVSTRDPEMCKPIVEVCKIFNVPFVGMGGTLHETIAKEYGVPFLSEFFADLEYDDNGRLIITRSHEAVDASETASRVMRALKCGKVKSVNGKDLNIKVDTVCVHSDTPGAETVARAVRIVVDTFNMKGGNDTTNQLNIRKILVANRGEIACRIMKTCRKMRIKTVAIYESADNTKHTTLADESVELPNGSTYTSIEAIVKICKDNGVDAVHPGYGFLSENPKFGKALKDAGITFLGPSSDAMETFALKHTAREFAASAGVPIVPGTGILEDVEDTLKHANRLTYPVMLKATGGGGGIGMQICNNAEQLTTAFDTCQTLAEKYFGNPSVYMEKYYPHSRHIEVQIFGNGLGNAMHLGERECSVQRRNQKVIEETPSPFLQIHTNLRKDMCTAAVQLVSQIKYQSAGTVEFLVVDEGETSKNTGKFYFLEMNTRLQVEHGVTELTNGVDLVEWMILQGNAERSGKGGLDLDSFHWHPSGHAIEVRLYAENPAKNFQPSPGLLTNVQWPNDKNVRVDTWVETGTRVSPLYDSLLAKVLVLGKDRDDAINNMLEALKNSTVAGPCTNIEYLQDVLRSKHFTSGNTTTQILSRIQFVANAIEVLRGGMETTVQGLPGRMALRIYGINPSGPMDDLAFQIANTLVGNEIGMSGLEITMRGPQLLFHRACIVAFAGAPMLLSFKDSKDADAKTFPMWSKVHIPAGGIVSIGKIPKGMAGCRCYMAIAGGLDIPDFLGSKSTCPAFGYGGFQGRPLQPGDMIPLSADRQSVSENKFSVDLVLPHSMVPNYQHHWDIKVVSGPYADPDYITTEGMDEIFSTDWKVHYNSNRMGVRLVGPTPKWTRADGGEGGSHPSNVHDYGYPHGSINFTGDSPVILTCEGPTQGGFVCPWTILSCELWKAGQVNPNDTIRFSPVSLEEALELREEYSAYLAHINKVLIHHPMSVPNRSFENITKTNKSTTSKGKRKSPLLLELPPDKQGTRPLIQYRQAGDCYVMVEYGDPMAPLDFNLRARVKVLQDTLRLYTDTDTREVEKPLIQGTLDAAPCIRSLLIRFDPEVLPQSTFIQYLIKLEDQMPDCSKMVFPSREIHMPFAFDDRWCREATQRYMDLIRKEASYLPSNVEFMAKNNGLSSKQAVCEKVTGSPWLVVGVGFYLGCPFMVPVHPLHRLNVPKYNPARTYTADGTVGMGGSFSCLYPLESPGGYQMYGRTIPTWNTFGSVEPFRPSQPWLLQMFDQVYFDLVSEDELLRIRKLAHAGKYTYKFTETTFDMAEQNKLTEELKDDIEAMHKRQKAGNKKMLAIESQLLKKQTKSASKELIQPQNEELPENQFGVEAGMAGCLKSMFVKVGDQVIANETVLCTLEAMKTEVSVTADEDGTIVKIMVSDLQQVSAETILCILEKKN